MSMPTDNATRAEQMKKEDLFAFNDFAFAREETTLRLHPWLVERTVFSALAPRATGAPVRLRV
jgi:hypothetical protein